jgi:hypothetical protein
MPEAAAACSCVLREQPGSAAGAGRCNCRCNKTSACYSRTSNPMPAAGVMVVRARHTMNLCSSIAAAVVTAAVAAAAAAAAVTAPQRHAGVHDEHTVCKLEWTAAPSRRTCLCTGDESVCSCSCCMPCCRATCSQGTGVDRAHSAQVAASVGISRWCCCHCYCCCPQHAEQHRDSPDARCMN